jgi:hypothetical protein
LNIFLVLLHDLQLVMVIWYSKEEGRWMKELWFTEPEKCSNNENENNPSLSATPMHNKHGTCWHASRPILFQQGEP